MVEELLESAKKADDGDDFIRIIPLPKIVFFYPTALVALICGIVMSLNSDVAIQKSLAESPDLVTSILVTFKSPRTVVFFGWIFMAVFTSNVMIISFDFPGVKFLAVAFALVAAVLGFALIATYYPDFLPGVTEILRKIRPVAMAQFYYFVGAVLAIAIISSAVIARYTNVWYLHSNELVHKRGILGDVEKYPTLHLRVTKEITDLFEFLLLMSGSLVMQPQSTDRPIVLENVMFINHKEKRIRELLGKLKISV